MQEKISAIILIAVILVAAVGVFLIFKGPGRAFEIIVKEPAAEEEKYCCCISSFGTLREVPLERYYSCKERCKLVGELYTEGKCPEE
jgi:hypothetical protein